MKGEQAVSAPGWMSPEAQEAWKRIRDGMITAGRWPVGELYHASLEMLCMSWGRWRWAERQRQEPGDHGEAWADVARTYLDRVRVMVQEFGETPAERAEVAGWLDPGGELLPAMLFAG